MKKFLALLVVCGMILSIAPLAMANGPVEKLGRGVANVATSPLGLLKGIGDANEESGIFAGLTWGVLQGTVNVVKRAAVGVYEVATFPIPLPKDYAPILDEPEFFLEKTKY